MTKAIRQKMLDTANETKRIAELFPESSAESFELQAAFACLMRARRISATRELEELEQEVADAREQP